MEKKGKFREKIAELEAISEKLGADIEIEESVELYEKGIKLARKIKTDLMAAEKKINILSEQGLKEVDEEEVGK